MKRLQVGILEKRAQWDAEAEHSARRAIAQGAIGIPIRYPTGLRMVRFAEPFGAFGMHYEVPPEVWDRLQAERVQS